MVMDLVLGGELFDFVAAHGRLEEAVARSFFQQLIDGIGYCHSRRVYHRDLKPENLLLSADKKILKITDFGLASIKTQNTDTELLHTIMGSPHYIAPEVITCAEKGYEGDKVDIWASGVILYGILAGSLPFDGDTTKELYNAIVHKPITFPKHFSYDVIKLLRAILHKDPSKRVGIEEIKTYPWFKVSYEPAPITSSGELIPSASERTASVMTDADFPSPTKLSIRTNKGHAHHTDSDERDETDTIDTKGAPKTQDDRKSRISGGQRKSLLALKERRNRAFDRGANNPGIFTISGGRDVAPGPNASGNNNKKIGQMLGALIAGHVKKNNTHNVEHECITPKKGAGSKEATVFPSTATTQIIGAQDISPSQRAVSSGNNAEEDGAGGNKAGSGNIKSHFYLRKRKAASKTTAHPSTPKSRLNANVFRDDDEKTHENENENHAVRKTKSDSDENRESYKKAAVQDISTAMCPEEQRLPISREASQMGAFHLASSFQRSYVSQLKSEDRSLRLQPSIFNDRSHSRQSEDDGESRANTASLATKLCELQFKSRSVSRHSSFNRGESHSLAEHRIFKSRSSDNNQSGDGLRRTTSDCTVFAKLEEKRSKESISIASNRTAEQPNNTKNQMFRAFASVSENYSADNGKESDDEDDDFNPESNGWSIVDKRELCRKPSQDGPGRKATGERGAADLDRNISHSQGEKCTTSEERAPNKLHLSRTEQSGQEHKPSLNAVSYNAEILSHADNEPFYDDVESVKTTPRDEQNKCDWNSPNGDDSIYTSMIHNKPGEELSDMMNLSSPLSPEANEIKSSNNDSAQHTAISVDERAQVDDRPAGKPTNTPINKKQTKSHNSSQSRDCLGVGSPKLVHKSGLMAETFNDVDEVEDLSYKENPEATRQHLVDEIRKEDHDNGYPPWNALGLDVFEDCDCDLEDNISWRKRKSPVFETIRAIMQLNKPAETSEVAGENGKGPQSKQTIFTPLDDRVIRNLSRADATT